MKLAAVIALVAAVACGSASPAPAPVSGSPLTVPQLKFAVMDSVGKPVYCDPDFYPLGRPEMPSALAAYPTIKADAETYAAIVAHEHLPSGDPTDDQKLTLYRAWKLLRAVVLTAGGGGFTFQYRVQSKTGSAAYEMVNGSVRVDGVVTVSSRVATGPPVCPICLAASTLIATPSGPVRVTEVRAGMVVWTEAADGSRIAAPVIEVGSMEAPAGHMMVHLVLADGRELLVSPGHRTADGRPVGSLKVGDALDGSTVATWELVPYAGGRTYDLLPAGATGLYWANGILLSSTLRTSR
ncbi:MAG TPA: hypothetical protein VFL27_11800 [Candidatus Dormibacteraeota bacterium]|nr:hypothetical protein [Candidatus Dormibacteraeota bacterium]